MKKQAAAALMMAAALAAGCGSSSGIKYSYGVFLGAAPEDIPQMERYKTIVLDAQYCSQEQIDGLKESGHTVYSYINIGSVEDFRPYYEKYEPLTLGEYENWEEERWVDVSAPEWQSFILEELAPGILEKHVDGFFVDNCDVYYNFPSDEIFEGTAAILKGLKDTGAYVSINGGDRFVTEYADRYGTLDGVMDAVNQETVFSKIEWDKGTFSSNPKDEREYFQSYAELVAGYGKDVYLLEYTTDKKLIGKISDYCDEKGYIYFAADDFELHIPKSSAGSQKIK